MKISMCATGDAMLLARLPEEYEFSSLAQEIKQCDARITNLESVFTKWDCNASTFCGGQWISSEPENLDDIMRFGFNLYGCANNHAMDYSFDGLRSTIKALQDRELLYAGIGGSLAEASRPCFLDISDKSVKVALISVATTTIHTDAARAGDSHGTIPPRPGINPLRIKTKYFVSSDHMRSLREIAQNTYINGERDNARRIGSLPPEDDNILNFGGVFFQTSGQEGKITSCDKRDLNRILCEIENAKRIADYVVVQIHSHQIKKAEYYEPDYFLEEFAHSCIDHGACMIVGGGTHQLKPVEIYKGKPIFYSLGNFIFQDEKIKNMPDDFWDKYNYDRSMSLADCKKKKTKNGTIGLTTDVNNYLSVLPIVEFEDGIVSSVRLFPISLGFNQNEDYKGLPCFADVDDFKTIAGKLANISSEYGTRFIIHDNYLEAVAK